MPIKVGDRLPEAKFRVMTGEGPAWKTTDEVFKGKKVALFAVPGAFTGTCHKMHVPSIVQSADGLKAKGINAFAALFHAGRGRRGEEAQHRGSARQGRGLGRRYAAQAAVSRVCRPREGGD